MQTAALYKPNYEIDPSFFPWLSSYCSYLAAFVEVFPLNTKLHTMDILKRSSKQVTHLQNTPKIALLIPLILLLSINSKCNCEIRTIDAMDGHTPISPLIHAATSSWNFYVAPFFLFFFIDLQNIIYFISLIGKVISS